MPDTLEWSPHPMKRPGHLLVGLLHLAVGLVFLLDAAVFHRVLQGQVLGPILGLLISLAVALAILVPTGNRRGPGRIAVLLIVAVSGLAIHLAATLSGADAPHAGWAFGGVLLAVGVLLVLVSEWRRRRVQVTLEGDRLSLFVKGYRLAHELPLDTVKDVSAARSFWGKMWGYGDFVARVRKGTMQEHITKPVVGEDPPETASRGNGWDEEERFQLVAAHPYKRVRRELENRILLAKMPPKEREEAELAHRLAEDLEGLRA